MQVTRTTAYPPLPKGGPQIVMPTQGDLQLRSLIPGAFMKQFAIHCTTEHRHIYTKFLIIRTFLVMTNDGNMFTQTLRTHVRLEDLPGRALLPLPPPLAPWDVVKVLDLVQCYTYGADGVHLVPNVRWELVRVRWRDSKETWVPVELLASQPPTLLHEFYVNSINSWGFHNRVIPASLALYRTESELWRHQDEFQTFYGKLRRKNGLPPEAATVTAASGGPASVVPANSTVTDVINQRPTASGGVAIATTAATTATVTLTATTTTSVAPSATVDVKDNRLTAEAARASSSTPQHPPVAARTTPARAPAGAIRAASRDRTAMTTTTTTTTTSPVRNGSHEQQSQRRAPRERESPASIQRQQRNSSRRSSPADELQRPSRRRGSERESSPETPTSRKRRRKRLLWSQARASDDSDASDDLLELSQPMQTRKNQRNQEEEEEENERRARHKHKKKKKEMKYEKKKSKQKSKTKEYVGGTCSVPIVLSDDDDDEEDDDDHDASGRVEIDVNAADYSDASHVDSDDDKAANGGQGTTETSSPMARRLGATIRCPCGATTIGHRYAGQWLQCWKENCGVWQHAECVGFLMGRATGDSSGATGASLALNKKYSCSTCDADAFTTRVKDASAHRLRKWLSLCCKTNNQRLLLQLLQQEDTRDASAAVKLAASTTGGHRQLTLLMEAARYGLDRVVRRLVRRYKVNVFTTNVQSRNVMHYAAKGKSLAIVAFLHAQAATLVRHQDLQGTMPLHLLLQSVDFNSFCVPLLERDHALCVTSDFAGTMPIHFASRVVNQATVAIVRRILAVDPSAATTPSPTEAKLPPLLSLCRAADATTPQSMGMQATCVHEIITLLLEDVDMFGRFLIARDPRGYTVLHFAAQNGNHALLQCLSQLKAVDADAITFDSGETALHLAARGNHSDAVRVLVENQRESVVAVDACRYIPLLRATQPTCLATLLHYELPSQLRRMSELARHFHHHEALREWLCLVVSDPMCYAVVNDWLQCNSDELALLDEVDELVALHRSFLRVDNKLSYLYTVVFPSLKRKSSSSSSKKKNVASTTTGSAEAEAEAETAAPMTEAVDPLEIVLSSSSGECYWTQLVTRTRDFDARVFRHQLRVVISRGEGAARIDNLTLVLVRVLSGLLQPTTGLLERRPQDATLEPSSLRQADDAETLRGFYVLGELVASLVVTDVPLGAVMEFSSEFLACVVGQPPQSAPESMRVFAMAFAGGFEAVLPATLALLHAHELLMVLSGPTQTALPHLAAVDWATALEWTGFEEPHAQNAVAWWTRVVTELVDQERVALVVWLAGSFRSAQRGLFPTAADADREDSSSDGGGRIRIQRYLPTSLSPVDQNEESDGTAIESSTTGGWEQDEEDELLPVLMEADTGKRTLLLPQYSSYESFRVGLMQVFRAVHSVTVTR